MIERQGNSYVLESPVRRAPPPRAYDRRRVLEKAGRARQRGKYKKAIELYEKVLADEPQNFDIHRKLGPLYAEIRQREESLNHFGRAVRELTARGFPDKAVGLCREAVGYYPTDPRIWEAIADLHLNRQRRADAFAALIEGRAHMRGRKLRGAAIRLLKRACVIEPEAVDPQIDLAKLLARSRQLHAACALLDRLAGRTQGAKRRAVLGARFRIAPSPGSFIRWARASLGL